MFHHLEVREPLTFTHAVHFGSIGLGLATAIGVSLRDTTRPTVLIAGDGGAMISLIELQTVARLELPVIVVVLDDGAYGAEYDKLKGFGVDPTHSLLSWPEFDGLSEALGVRARTVRSEQDFLDVADDIAAGRLPLLIDIKCDPTIDPRRR